jgi:glycosyltransferase involved in cell wall biosynthesis
VVESALVEVVRQWRPHVVHTLGLFNSGLYWFEIAQGHGLLGLSRWVMQLRGGSDLELNRLVPETRARICAAAAAADQIVSDNRRNFAYLRSLGIDERRFAPISPVPGSGGVERPGLRTRPIAPEQRRMILWPKAYNTAFALALPVLEALKLAWDRIRPCRIVLTWMVQDDVRAWIEALPSDLRSACEVHGRLGREEIWTLMSEARVMLAPSLVDGVPNTLYEAMVSGALPIVSPLDTLTDIVEDGVHVLFARNLYPDEITAALVSAMTDADLLRRITTANILRVTELADRTQIARRVSAFYRNLAGPDATPCVAAELRALGGEDGGRPAPADRCSVAPDTASTRKPVFQYSQPDHNVASCR